MMKVAEVEPDGTMIAGGGVAYADDELSAMMAPDGGAGPASETWQLEMPEVREAGLQTSPLKPRGCCCCVIEIVWPATLKYPVRAAKPLLAVTVQLMLLPESDAEAQSTFELTGTVGQSRGLGKIAIVPDMAAAPTIMLVLPSL